MGSHSFLSQTVFLNARRLAGFPSSERDGGDRGDPPDHEGGRPLLGQGGQGAKVRFVVAVV